MNVEKWAELNELREKGLISQEEYEVKKKEILNGLSSETPSDKKEDAGKISLWQYFIYCITKKYASFKGRAPRSEYWGFTLYTILLSCLLGFLGGLSGLLEYLLVVGALLPFVFVLPSFAVTVRRFHDCNKSGKWLLVSFALGIIPWIIGDPVVFLLCSSGGIVIWLVFFYWLVKRGDDKENKYGPVPTGLDK